eukprot:TRINITY_DN7461_c0_g1_i1.p1 TRINITY_DN7461_c0_g1~~TRINITY_DN7461_c0_g1_i1.p1  ORF type:complete len:734 (-),score=246.82 TRINITY_DN7461_c0_g1_i1:116-2293(-)
MFRQLLGRAATLPSARQWSGGRSATTSIAQWSAQRMMSSTFKRGDGKMFDKILIANRGEIACRVMRTAKKMGIKTVAIYSTADEFAMHTRMADEAICVGPAASAESYLNIPVIVEAIKSTGAQAVHPGYGFLSENANFVQAVEDAGAIFIGPHPKAMHAMGDKIESKRLATEAGVSVIPGFVGEVHNDAEVLKIAQDIGYPVMIKASAGGGGKGMRVAWNDAEALSGFKLSKQEAASSFGDDRMLIEKFIDEPRHIEIQVLGDSFGNYVYLNERECSIQRRNQKVIEEAPSSFIDPETREKMGKQAIQLAQAVDYESAGTVEMLVDSKKNFYFLEMNTRLQVEHPVTEYITKQDLVEHMIRVAAGEKLSISQKDIGIHGWSFESRVYAEDPYRNFLPSIGNLTRYSNPPLKDGEVRVDNGVEEGSEISVFYDPLIAKLVSHGDTREAALQNMSEALDSYVIRGVENNVSFLRAVMDNKRFRDGNITTKFIEEEFPDGFHGRELNEKETQQLLSVAAGMHFAFLYRGHSISDRLASAQVPFVANLAITLNGKTHTVAAGIPNMEDEEEHHEDEPSLVVQVDGESPAALDQRWNVNDALYFGAVNGEEVVAQLMSKRSDRMQVQFLGTKFNLEIRSTQEQELSKWMHAPVVLDTSNMLLSPMPGKVLSVDIKAGDKVVVGQELVVVEAMKMQNALRADFDGVVESVKVKVGDSCNCDEILVVFKKEK